MKIFTRFLFFFLICGLPIWMDVRIASTFSLSKITFLRLFSLLILIGWIIRLSRENIKFIKTPLFFPLLFYLGFPKGLIPFVVNIERAMGHTYKMLFNQKGF